MTWSTVELDTAANVIRGVTFSKGDASDKPAPGLVPVLRAGNIGDQLNTEDDLVFVDESFVSENQRLQPDDIVVCMSSGSANVLGKSAILDSDWEGTFGAFLAAVRPRADVIFPRFLAQYLRTSEFRTWASSSSGIGIKNIRASDFKSYPIPLPPLEEQRRIAGMLDQADALRRLRSRALDKLNSLGQAIFHEMFGDVVTNPLGWDSIKLDKLCEVGSSKRVFVQEFVSDGVPFYRGTEVGRLGSGGRIEPSLFISADHYESLIKQSGKPAIGDLLLPSICHDGRIWKVDHSDPFYFKDGRVLWIKSGKSKIDSEYLRGYLRNLFLKSYASIASGTTFAELKIVNLKNLPILCPPMRLQKEFSSRIAEVEACRSKFAQTTSASMSLFASLQHRAFKGEL